MYVFFICRLRHTPLNSIAVAGVAGAQVAIAGVCGHGDAGTRLRLLVRHAAAHSPDHLKATNKMKDIKVCFHVSILLIFWGFPYCITLLVRLLYLTGGPVS